MSDIEVDDETAIREANEERVMIALKQPTLREQIAAIIDPTAALGTPEVIYRLNHGESVREAADRLHEEVLAEADLVLALLAARLTPHQIDVAWHAAGWEVFEAEDGINSIRPVDDVTRVSQTMAALGLPVLP